MDWIGQDAQTFLGDHKPKKADQLSRKRWISPVLCKGGFLVKDGVNMNYVLIYRVAVDEYVI